MTKALIIDATEARKNDRNIRVYHCYQQISLLISLFEQQEQSKVVILVIWM